MKNKYTKHHFDFYLCKHGRGGGFLTSLYDTMGRADQTNLAKFKLGFPEEHGVYLDWYNSKDETIFFGEIREQFIGKQNG